MNFLVFRPNQPSALYDLLFFLCLCVNRRLQSVVVFTSLFLTVSAVMERLELHQAVLRRDGTPLKQLQRLSVFFPSDVCVCSITSVQFQYEQRSASFTKMSDFLCWVSETT